MIKDADGSFRKYNNAARWYLTNDGDKAQALEWAQKSVDQDKKVLESDCFERSSGCQWRLQNSYKDRRRSH